VVGEVPDEGGVVEAERDEDCLLIGDFRLEPEWHAVGAVEDVLVEDVEVAVVSDGSVYEGGAVCVAVGVHFKASDRRWYKITRILVLDYSRSTWDCRSHLFTQITSGMRIFCVSTPSGSGRASSSAMLRSKVKVVLRGGRGT
jgi:hypothetical protein